MHLPPCEAVDRDNNSMGAIFFVCIRGQVDFRRIVLRMENQDTGTPY